MKIRLHLKDYDGVFDSLDEIVKAKNRGASKEELRAAHRELEKKIDPWVSFGEYVSIEIDTETNTATVLKA